MTQKNSPEKETEKEENDNKETATALSKHREGDLWRILVVEDDSFMRNVLERKFVATKKYEVHVADTVREARTLLERQAIDLVCLDLMLPEEDGFALLQFIKASETLRHIPVLILSNLGQQEEIARGKELGAADFMVKANTSPGDIIERVDALLK